MEFDARSAAADKDKVGWETKLTLPDGEVVNLQFRDYAQIPSKISLYAIGDDERQLWQALRWGLISPKNWPKDKPNGEAIAVFSDIPAKMTVAIHEEWQRQSGVTQGESSASTTSSESTETS